VLGLAALLLALPACGEEFAQEGHGGQGGGAPLPPTEPFSLSTGSTGDQWANAVAVDHEGNIIVTGQFEYEIDLGGGPMQSAGETYPDIFIAKLDPNGEHLWSRRFGGTSTDRGTAVAVDAEGNILLGASFAGTVEFDGEALTADSSHILIAKFDPEGDHLWHRTFGESEEETGSSYPSGMALDSEGNIVVIGTFSGSLLLDTEQVATSDSHQDAFVAKLDPDGAPLWSTAFGGDVNDTAFDVAIGPNDEIAVTGDFSGLATIVGYPWTAPTSGSMPYPNAYVIHLTADGEPLWGKNLGDTSYQYGYGIDVGPDGTTYATGGFYGSINFDGVERTSHGSYDVYLAAYDNEGGIGWAWQAGDDSGDNGRQVKLAPDGKLMLAGTYTVSIDLGTTVLHAEDSSDLFLAQLDTEAHPLWSRSYGGMSTETLRDMAVDRAGNTILVGYFEGTLEFDDGPLSAVEEADLFIAKIAPPTTE
jgi:hypothetical protein